MKHGDSLPTSPAAEAVLAKFRTDSNLLGSTDCAKKEHEEKWRDMCLHVLSYGTNFNYRSCSRKEEVSGNIGNNTKNLGSESKFTVLKDRTLRAIQFLTYVLKKWLNEKNSDRALQNEPNPFSILIDTIWGVGWLLEPQPNVSVQSAANATNGSSSSVGSSFNALPSAASIEQHQALVYLLRGLSEKLPESFTRGLLITLDASLLSSSHLITTDKTVLTKRFKKYQTNMIYRQKKFNLLVEESEGYAKVLSFLFSSQTLLDQNENGNGVSVFVRELMGTFDLDPNRVLDLLLDAVEIYLGRGIHGNDEVKTEVEKVLRILNKVLAEYKRESLPHLIGFKVSSGGGSNPSYPDIDSLLTSCAYLICQGLVDFKAIVPYFKESVEQMNKDYRLLRESEVKRIRKIGNISLNPSTTSEGKDKGEKEDPPVNCESNGNCSNHLISLTSALLSMGAWDLVFEASSLHFPQADSKVKNQFTVFEPLSQICILNARIGQVICKLLHKVIEPVYNSEVTKKYLIFEDSEKEDAPKRKGNQNQSLFPLPGCIPSCVQTTPITDIKELSSSLYNHLMVIAESGCIQKDPILYVKLCRLFKLKLSTMIEVNDVIDSVTLKLVRRFLVPSLSLFVCNPSISSELWACLGMLPYSIRYSAYDSWRGPFLEKESLDSSRIKTSSSYPSKSLLRIESEIETGIECRYVLKRLSRENIKDQGRKLAKSSHNNPIVAFSTVLNQIETYDNLISLMIESFRFVTKLGLDVVGYCIWLSLGGGRGFGKSRVKSHGLSTTQWLSSLSQFTGAFFKRFPEVEMRAILSHIIRELKQGHISELLVLRTLLKSAGGYDFADCNNISSLSQKQLEGRAGSQLLKRETSSFGVVEKLNKKSSKRLREILLSKDIGLPLLILLAQTKDKIMYETSEGRKLHLKVIGTEHDSCHSVLCLLLEFLADSTDDEKPMSLSSTTAKYAGILPRLKQLIVDYGVSSTMAWMLCRPLVRASMSAEHHFRNCQEPIAKIGLNEEKEEGEANVENTEIVSASTSGGTSVDSNIPSFLRNYSPSCEEMISVYECMPVVDKKYISTAFYLHFWSLSLYDICCPTSRYESEISRLRKGDGSKALFQNANISNVAGRDSIAPMISKSDEQERDRVRKNIETLTAELKVQNDHCNRMQANVIDIKSKIFSSSVDNCNVIDSIISSCIFPRCILSPEDALYCAKFIKLLYKNGNSVEESVFNIFCYWNKLLPVIAGALFCVTEDEAGNIGIFLYETWTTISQWRYDDSRMKDESVKKMVSKVPLNKETSSSDLVELYNKWHSMIGMSLLGCLQSSEYIHIRAAIIVLNRIVSVFPTRPTLGNKLLRILYPLQEETSRPDIKTMASSYAGQLEKARKDGVWKDQSLDMKTKLMEEAELKAEEKRKDAERRFDEMKKDNEKIDNIQSHHHARTHARPHARGHLPIHAPQVQRPQLANNHGFSTVNGSMNGRPYTGAHRNDIVLNSNPNAIFTPPNGGVSRDLYPQHTPRDPRDHRHHHHNHSVGHPPPPLSQPYRDRRNPVPVVNENNSPASAVVNGRSSASLQSSHNKFQQRVAPSNSVSNNNNNHSNNYINTNSNVMISSKENGNSVSAGMGGNMNSDVSVLKRGRSPGAGGISGSAVGGGDHNKRPRLGVPGVQQDRNPQSSMVGGNVGAAGGTRSHHRREVGNVSPNRGSARPDSRRNPRR